MLYAKSTFKYIKKHFFVLLAYTVLPAIVLAFSSSPNDIVSFLRNYSTQDFSSFFAIFKEVTQVSWISVLWFLLSDIFLCIFISALCSVIERDVRLGVFKYKKFFRDVNNNFLNVFRLTLIFLIMIEVFGTLVAMFIYFFSFIHSAVVAIVLTSVVVAVLGVVLLTCIIYLLMTLPTMVITGLNLNKSITISIKATKGHFWKLLLGLIIPVFPSIFFVLLDSLLKLGCQLWFSMISNTFLFLYLIPFIFVSYCDINGIDREDLKNNLSFINR